MPNLVFVHSVACRNGLLYLLQNGVVTELIARVCAKLYDNAKNIYCFMCKSMFMLVLKLQCFVTVGWVVKPYSIIMLHCCCQLTMHKLV